MKAGKWLFLALFPILVIGLFFWVVACGDDDDDDEEEDTPEPSDNMPDCISDYPSEPFCDGTVAIEGLEWTICDTGQDIDHNCATHYIKDLDFDGKTDWRFPTVAELEALYSNQAPQSVNCESYMANIVEPFELTCFQVWSGEEGATIPDSYVAYSFLGSASQTEGQQYDIEADNAANMRALAVRDL